MTRPARFLIIGWLIAGTLDITYAISFSYLRTGLSPTRLLQFVASGALGRDAFEGGLTTAAAGLFFHYLNAYLFTVFFFAAARKLPSLLDQALASGALYGIGIYVVMNYIVVPLSRIGPRPTPATIVWTTGLLVHMFAIGVPIAMAAKKGLGPKSAE